MTRLSSLIKTARIRAEALGNIVDNMRLYPAYFALLNQVYQLPGLALEDRARLEAIAISRMSEQDADNMLSIIQRYMPDAKFADPSEQQG